MKRLVLVLVVAPLVLAGCGGSSGNTADHGPDRTATSGPAMTSTTQTAAPCSTGEVRAALANASADSRNGQVTVELVLSNDGPSSCLISGLPQVHAFDPQGKELPNSPALAAIGVTLSKTLRPGAAVTLKLVWVGTGQGAGCGANHFATVGSITAVMEPGNQPVRADASVLPDGTQGICWVDAIEIEQGG